MAISGVDSILYTQSKANTSSSSSSNSLLSMDDFLSLMVAQLANQDMYNPVDNSEYIAQMAQFSMIQALTEMTKASSTSYGVSLIGKEATVATTDGSGYTYETTGIVEGVNLYNGETRIVIDGEPYSLSSVTRIAEPKIIIPVNPTNTTNQTGSAAAESATDTEGGDSND